MGPNHSVQRIAYTLARFGNPWRFSLGARMEKHEMPEYLNLDLVCTSKKDLTPLIEHFGNRVDVLCNDKNESGFYVVLELQYSESKKRYPEIHARHFLELIETLPSELRAIWNECASKTFDFGFRSGFGVQAFISEISQSTLAGIVSLGASIDISIYPVEKAPKQE